MRRLLKKYLPNIFLLFAYLLLWASAVDSNFDPEHPIIVHLPTQDKSGYLHEFTNFLTNKPFLVILETCIVCGSNVDQKEIVSEAQLKNLPSPCCQICFEIRDDPDSSITTIARKSLAMRKEIMARLRQQSEHN